jgi:hypothetical protein
MEDGAPTALRDRLPGPLAPQVAPKLFSNISKEVWLQCQAFTRNALAVLWDFKRLQ